MIYFIDIVKAVNITITINILTLLPFSFYLWKENILNYMTMWIHDKSIMREFSRIISRMGKNAKKKVASS